MSDHWQPLTAESVKATQALLEDTFGMTDDLYRSSTYLAQNDGSFFCEAPPTKRKGILAEGALGRTPVWPRALEAVRKDKRAAETTLAGLVARIEQAEEELAEKKSVQEGVRVAQMAAGHAAKFCAGFEKRLEALVEQQRQAEQRVSERRAAEAEHQAAEQKREQLREQAEQADSARESIRDAQERLKPLATVEDLQAADEEYQAAMNTWGSRAHEIDQLEWKLSNLGDRVCGECGRPYEDADEIAKAELKIRERLAEVGPLGPEPSRLALSRVQEETRERVRIEERIAAWQRAVEAVEQDDWQETFAVAEGAVVAAGIKLAQLPPIDQAEIARIQQQTLEARAQVNEQRQRLDDARQEKARLEERLERLQQVEAQAAEWRQERDRLRERLDVLAILERAYGRDGIPSLIVEAVAIPVIEAEANRILGELGTLFRVELRTQREKKDGDLADALDVVVVDEHGCERDYLSYSGGEKTRLAISLRIAFAVYMATSGAGSRTLIVDEPEGLDDAGMAALADVMRQLGGVFERQLLVSHVPALKDAFDSVISVVREDGRSRIEQAAAGSAPIGVAAGVAA